MSSDSDIRTTLRQAAGGADAPSIDEVGFDRRVRRYRHRRRASVMASAAALAAVVVAGLPVVDRLAPSGPGPEPSVAGNAQPRPPAYITVGGRAKMLDPAGKTHDLRLRADDGILGATTDGVVVPVARYAGGEYLETLIRFRVSSQDGEWKIRRDAKPIARNVRGAAVSADGTRLAYATSRDDLVVYDLVTDTVRDRIPHDQKTKVLGYADEVLYSTGDTLWFGTGDGAVEVPASPETFEWGASAGGNRVAARDSEGEARLFEVVDGAANPIESLSGAGGQLSPDGRYYAANDDASGTVTILEPGLPEPRALEGLEGTSEEQWGAMTFGWLDNDTVLVSWARWAGEQDRLLYACEADTLRCEAIFDAPGRDIFL